MVINGKLTVHQDVTASSTLKVNGDTSLDGRLQVQGDVTAGANLNMQAAEGRINGPPTGNASDRFYVLESDGIYATNGYFSDAHIGSRDGNAMFRHKNQGESAMEHSSDGTTVINSAKDKILHIQRDGTDIASFQPWGESDGSLFHINSRNSHMMFGEGGTAMILKKRDVLERGNCCSLMRWGGCTTGCSARYAGGLSKNECANGNAGNPPSTQLQGMCNASTHLKHSFEGNGDG